MPRKHTIVIKEQPGDRAAPDQPRQPVHIKDVVVFLPEELATGVKLEFLEGNPFIEPRPEYRVELHVIPERKPGKNVFPYSCTMKKGDRTLTGVGGGEIEILSGEGGSSRGARQRPRGDVTRGLNPTCS